MTRLKMDKLVSEVLAWSVRNFGCTEPGQLPSNPLLGIVEECGELEEALTRSVDTDVLDAAGDIMIYLADYCGRRGFDLSTIILKVRAVPASRKWDNPLLLLRYAGKLCHAHLKQAQNIRGTAVEHSAAAESAIGCLVMTVVHLLDSRGIDLQDAIDVTWDKVSKRNWQSNALTGEANDGS